MNTILVIDDDDFIRSILSTVLKKDGYKVYDAGDGETGLDCVNKFEPDLVITDYKMPGISGLEVVTQLTRTHPGLPVIMLTAFGDVTLTIKAIQAGAYDFIEKPLKNYELLNAVQNGVKASKHSRSLNEVITAQARMEIKDNFPAGKTPAMREIFKNIGRISLTKVNVVIIGEPGTGKDQLAHLIHYTGVNREYPFTKIYCRSDEEEKLEHELFGYSSDAVPSGKGARKGKIELCGEGTVFLNEFHNLPEKLQKKLLYMLEKGEIEKPGQVDPIPLRARFIVSTTRDIEALVAENKFLKDLYYRLKMFSIYLPPLKKRIDDIPELVQSLLVKLNRKFNKQVVKVEEGITDLLKAYDWPGNVRELENTLTQAIILSHGDVLEKKNIPPLSGYEPEGAQTRTDNLKSIADIEKVHIKRILDSVNWNKMAASSVLKITRPTLNKKIEKYKLESPHFNN
jgi:DNA-binding NtrC family response regulator